MDQREFMRQFEVEARRLRLNMYRLPALAASDTGAIELLERMRGLAPGATWEDVIPGIQLPEPDREIGDLVAATDSDPEAFWQERELALELWRELERVVPTDTRGETMGFEFSHDLEHALRVLRRLPDGAGFEAFFAALESTPVDE